MQSLQETFLLHPQKKEILDRLSDYMNLSENSTRRKIKDGSALGKKGVINILFSEFAIEIRPDETVKINFDKLAEIQKAKEKQEEKKQKLYGLQKNE